MNDTIQQIRNFRKSNKFNEAVDLFRVHLEFFKSDNSWHNNDYFLQDIFTSYKEVKNVYYIGEFLNGIDLGISATHNAYTVSSYGWLCYEYLELFSKNTDVKIKKALDLLTTISCNLFNIFSYPNHSKLFSSLLYRLLSLELTKKAPSAEFLIDIFKAINIRNNNAVKQILQRLDYLTAKILDVFKAAKESRLALRIIDSNVLGIKIDSQSEEKLINSFGWLLYANCKDDNEKPEISLPRIKKHINLFSKQGQYSPFSKLYKLVIKKMKSNDNTDWKVLIQFLDSINEEELSVECPIQNINNEDKELASDLEDWYANKIKGHYELGDYQEVVNLGIKSFDKIERFHYRNDQWINRNIARSYKELKDYKNAEIYLDKFQKRNKDWYGFKDKADLLLCQKKYQDALNNAILATQGNRDMDKKGKVYSLIAQLLEQLGQDLEIAYIHYVFAAKTRERSDWSVTDDIEEGINRLRNLGTLNTHKVDSLDYHGLRKELQKYWKPKYPAKKGTPKKKIKGIISKLNINKGLGTITNINDSKDQYFFFCSDITSNNSSPKQGDQVIIYKTFAPKQKGKLPRAKNIKII